MKKLFIIFIGFCLWLLPALGAVPPVKFYNKGKIHVKASAEMFVNSSVRMTDVSEITQNGTTQLVGDFYQDSQGHVFISTSSGIIRFISNGESGSRRITSSSLPLFFDRAGRYIAFPQVEIGLNNTDSLILEARMAMDAASLKQVNSSKAVLLLSSGVYGAGNDSVYDASLRITALGSSADVVDKGAVVVERDVSLYRSKTSTSGYEKSNAGLFPFATPFNGTQYAGYFAGNWLRKHTTEGEFNHVRYVMANKPSTADADVIDASQYLRYAQSKLEPGQPYIVKPRPAGYNYSDLQQNNGLGWTDDAPAAYDKGKFVFDGNVYNMASSTDPTNPNQEQLFADDVLVNRTIDAAGNICVDNNANKPVNWVLGNSYTCAIDAQKLAEAMKFSGLPFYPQIYIYQAGANSFTPYSITENPIVVNKLKDIPSMSIFLLRLKGNAAANSSLEINKSMLSHGQTTHNALIKAPSANRNASSNGTEVNDQIILRLSDYNNNNIYDLAAIGLRSDASSDNDIYDMAKIVNAGNEGFQIYSLSSSGSRLAINGLPLNTQQSILCVQPEAEAVKLRLAVSHQQSLSSQGCWLEDTKTGSFTDLMQDDEYVFDLMPEDSPERFVIHFDMTPTDFQNPESPLVCYYDDNSLVIKELRKEDLGSNLYLVDMQGKIIGSYEVSNYPVIRLYPELLKGVYAVKIIGNRNLTTKFLK